MNKWDERFAVEEYIYGTQANDFLQAQISQLPENGRLLCMGDGEGRNGVYLARQGFKVTSVDASQVGLDKAWALAQKYGVSLDLIHADLRDFDFKTDCWHGVVSIFCHLPQDLRLSLYPKIKQGLKSGGIYLNESYTPAQLRHNTGGPKDLTMLLTQTEVEQALSGFHYHCLQELERRVTEGSYHTGIAAVLQVVAEKP